MNLREIMRDDAANVFANPGEHARPVTYYPEGHLYDPREMNAVIDYAVPAADGPDQGQANLNEITIQVPNDPAGEKGMAQVLVGEDLVECPDSESDDATTVRWRVVEILDQDAGMWTLRVAR